MNPGGNVSTFQCYWSTFGFIRSGLRAKARVTDSIIGWKYRKIRLLSCVYLLNAIKILIRESTYQTSTTNQEQTKDDTLY